MTDKSLPPVEFNVLVVEDEEMICEIMEVMLRRHGFAVTTASDAERAVLLAKTAAPPFDAVLLDLGLPGMSGEACLEQLLAIDPACRIVIASGTSEHAKVARLLARGAKGFASKPFDFVKLSHLLRQIIAA